MHCLPTALWSGSRGGRGGGGAGGGGEEEYHSVLELCWNNRYILMSASVISGLVRETGPGGWSSAQRDKSQQLSTSSFPSADLCIVCSIEATCVTPACPC